VNGKVHDINIVYYTIIIYSIYVLYSIYYIDLIIFSNTRPQEPSDDQEEDNSLNLIFIPDRQLYYPALLKVKNSLIIYTKSYNIVMPYINDLLYFIFMLLQLIVYN